MREYNSYVQYTGDGQTTDFTVPFPYLAREHVTGTINGVTQFLTWPDGSTVRFVNQTPEDGTTVEIRRITPVKVRQVEYQEGARIPSAKDLNTDSTQMFFLIQEVRDGILGALFGSNPSGLDGLESDTGSIVERVTEKMVDSELYQDLQSTIADIDTNSESILSNSDLLANVDQVAADLGYDQEDLAEASIKGYLREDDSLSRVRLLTKRTADAEASISDIETVINSGDLVKAEDLETVETKVDDNTASIETNATSINGVQAKYTVKLDVNDRVIGFGLINDANDDTTNGGAFVIQAEQFSVIDPDTGDLFLGWDSATSTFSIDGDLLVDGTVFANKLDIAQVDQISNNLGIMTAGTFKTTDNSTGMRVEISDSGSYPMWYGSGAKSAANATFYLDANGNAMYRGGLDVSSSTSDGSVEIKDNVIKVFDGNGALRVQLGDLTA